jgi:pilus assembly protein CpaB
MRARTILIVLALFCALGVVGVLIMNAQAPPVEQAAPTHPHMVVSAVGANPVGTLIKPQDVAITNAPANVAAGATFDRNWTDKIEDQAVADGKTVTEVVGAVARRRIDPGQPIYRDSVVKPGDSGFLAAVLKPGMRAVTVGVNVVSGAGGLIYPGDHVDLLLTQSFAANDTTLTKRSVTETVAENLRVLAIDQTVQAAPPPTGEGRIARTVTLEVEPRSAEKITVAVRLGELSLTIRSLEQNGEGSGTLSTDATAPAGSAPAGGVTPAAATATPPGAAPTQQAATPGSGDNTSVPAPWAPVAPAWSGDVSPALKATADAAEKAAKPQVAPKPPVLVIRGDKSDEVGVH